MNGTIVVEYLVRAENNFTTELPFRTNLLISLVFSCDQQLKGGIQRSDKSIFKIRLDLLDMPESVFRCIS